CRINVAIALIIKYKIKTRELLQKIRHFSRFGEVRAKWFFNTRPTPTAASLCRNSADDVNADPVTGEEGRDAEETAGKQRALRDALGPRAREGGAQDQQADGGEREVNDKRMCQHALTEGAALAEEPEREAPSKHQPVPPDVPPAHAAGVGQGALSPPPPRP